MRVHLLTAAILVTALTAAGGHAADLAITADPYSTAGLFTNPLIPVEGDVVTITVRASVAGDVNVAINAEVTLTAPDGRSRHYAVALMPEEGQATGSLEWKAWRNGRYVVTARLDPKDELAEANEDNNSAEIELPVVIPGRKPHFPWFSQRDYLRWATIWAGGYTKEMTVHWQERGVLPLRWKYGVNLPGEWDEERIYKMNCGFDESSGVAVDECGYYPTPEAHERFATYMRGLARAKHDNPQAFFLMWHCGSLYPEQAALYRGACDLVVLESYVFYYAPQFLGTENIYDFLDMKMRPARQVDLLVPTGKGTQVITSVDLNAETFNRGKLENIIRHLRRRWPEMRGFGVFGGAGRGASKEQMAQGIADDKFVDQLCHDYFIMPVLTILPGNLWVNREDDGAYRVEVTVSNIGGMNSGPVEVRLYADGKLLKKVNMKRVPAGDNLLENCVLVSAPWPPVPGPHQLTARLGPAPGSTVLDAEIETNYFVP